MLVKYKLGFIYIFPMFLLLFNQCYSQNNNSPDIFSFIDRFRLIKLQKSSQPFVIFSKINVINSNEWIIDRTFEKIKVNPNKLNLIELKIDGILWKIAKIVPKHSYLKINGTRIRRNESTIILKSINGKYTLKAQAGKPIYSPRPVAVIKDKMTSTIFKLKAGEYIIPEVTNKKRQTYRRRKIKKYKILKIDIFKKQVIIESPKNNKFILKPKGSAIES